MGLVSDFITGLVNNIKAMKKQDPNYAAPNKYMTPVPAQTPAPTQIPVKQTPDFAYMPAVAAANWAKALEDTTPVQKQQPYMIPNPVAPLTPMQKAKVFLQNTAVRAIPWAQSAINIAKGITWQSPLPGEIETPLDKIETGVWQVVGEVWKAAKWLYQWIIKPLVVDPQAEWNMKNSFLDDNMPVTDKLFDRKWFGMNNASWNDKDWKILDEIETKYDQKRALLNDTSTSLEDRAPMINQIQNEIYTDSLWFSKADINNMPKAWELEDLVNKHKKLKQDINTMKQVPATPEDIKNANLTASATQAYVDKIGVPISDANLQWRNWRWTTLTTQDLYPTIEKFVSSASMQHMLIQPVQAKQSAVDQFAQAKTPADRKKWMWYINQAQELINRNDQRVVPYIQYLTTNLWTKAGDSINDITETYLKKTGQKFEDIFWEHDTSNAILTALMKSPTGIITNGVVNTLLDGIDSLDKTMLNRWDVAQQMISEMRFKSWNIWQKIMEWIWLWVAKWLDNPLNTLKWDLLYSWPARKAFWVLWKMDMESFANIENQIAPPKWWWSTTRNGLKDRTRTAVQMTPEIIAQIAPSIIWGEVISGIEGANDLRLAWKVAGLAEDTAWMVKDWESLFALSKKRATMWPQYEAYLAEGKSAAEAAKLIWAKDYFMNKVFTQTARLVLNNYIQSAAMQTHNAKAYWVNDFFIDSTFAWLDAIVDTTRLLNHYVKDDLAYKNMFIDTLSKNLRDIPEDKWKTLPIEDKAAFQDITKQYMEKYNNVIKWMNPDKVKSMVADFKKQADNLPVISQVEEKMKADPSWSINFKDAHTNKWIPDYMDEQDYNLVIQWAKTPEDALSLFDQLRKKDKTWELKGLNTQERAVETRQTINNFINQSKLAKDKNVVSWYKNLIKDIQNEMWDKGKIRIDGEDWNYQFQSQNLEPLPGKSYKDPITWKMMAFKTKWEQQRMTYTLLKDWETIWEDGVIKDAAGNIVSNEDRSLTFHRAYDPKTQTPIWEFRGTMLKDKIGKTVDKIESIIPESKEIPLDVEWTITMVEHQPKEFQPIQWIMTPEEMAQNEHMFTLNTREITDNTTLEKLHWFSNLSDALKRSGIDNDWFQQTKRTYSIEKDALWNDIPLRVTLRDQAKTWKDLTPEQFDAFKAMALQSANDFFSQAPDLIAKIEKKLKNLNLVDVTRRPELEKLTEALAVAKKSGDASLQKTLQDRITAFKATIQTPLNTWVMWYFQDLVWHVGTVTNDVSVLSRLAWDWGLGEFLKFFDPKKYVDIRDNQEIFKAFFGLNFPANDWNRYRTLWKYISNDTAEAQRVKNTLKYSWLNASAHLFWQTVMNFVGMPKMLVMNSLAFVVEQMRKYKITNFSNEEMWAIREKFNLLYSTDEYAYKEIGNIDWWLQRALKRVQTKASQFYDSWLYNAADVFYSTSIKNESVAKAIEEILPHITDTIDAEWKVISTASENFSKFIENQSRENQVKILTDIQQRAEALMNKRTWQFNEFRKTKVTVWWDAGMRSQIKAASYRTYSLMGGRGMGMMHASAETIAQAVQSKLIRWTFWKQYTHLLQEEGKYAADKRALEYVSKNEDFLHFTEKLTAAISLGAKQSRMMADNDWETDYISTMKEARELGKNFSFPLQSFDSNPFGRATQAFLQWLFEDVNNDGKITWMDVAAWWVLLWKQVTQDFFRRFSVIKAVLGATKDAIENWWGLDDYVANLIKEFKKNTWGFLYYSAQDVTNNWFDLYIPHTANSFLMQIMPYTDKYIGDFQKMNGKASMEKLLTDFPTYGTNRLSYNLPLLKDWNMWWFTDAEVTKQIVDSVGNDTFYQDYILKWEIDWSKTSDDMKQYAYAQLTNMSSMWTKYKDPKAWFDDMRKSFDFTTDTGLPMHRPARQNQEDLFVDQMKQALGDWAYKTFVDLFNTSVKWNQKAAIQMIAFADAKSPWSGKEILANLVSDQWYQMMIANWWFVSGWINQTVSDAVEKQLWATYGNMVFITDKPQWWKNISLYYTREQHPELQKYISDPFDKNGKPMKDMKFIYGKVDWTDEQWSYENKIMSQLYAMDLMAKIKVAWWDTDWYKLANAFATLRMPKNVDNKSAAFNGMMLKGINHALDYINTSHLTTEDKVEMKSWIFMWVYTKLADVSKNIDMFTPADQEVFWQTMNFLHWTTKEITELGKAKWAQQYFKDASWYSLWSWWSSYYAPTKKYPATALYDSAEMRQLSYLFSPYKAYGTSYKSSWSKYYSAKDRDYLVEYGKQKWTGVARISDFGKQQPDKAQPTGRTPAQKGWSARRFTKLADPDKPFDFTTVSTFKRKLSRKAIRYDNSGVRKSGLGWWLYNVSYQGGNRKRRVSRSKGSNSKGSAKYNKTSG